MPTPAIENKSFIVLLVLISIAFVWLMLPFYGAIFWGVILAILFAPLQRHLSDRLKQRKTLAAFITLLVIILMVILPVSILTTALVQEGIALYQRVSSGEQNFGFYFQQVMQALPPGLQTVLMELDLFNPASVQEKLTATLMTTTQFVAGKAVTIGQNTFSFVVSLAVMLYLLFFLLRDGPSLAIRVHHAIPLGLSYREHFLDKFTTVIKATVKGNVIIALLQGTLGGLIFWALDVQGALLWGFIMAILSLLPAVGASLIWAPVALYFLLTGAIWQGIVLSAFGFFVIGLIDNLLRPILVGRDTKMPDYVVLISTLGGLTLLGLNGFVIGPLIAALFIAAWSLFTDARDLQAKANENAD